MWFKMKKTVIPLMLALVAVAGFSARSAYALNDDETAVIVGIATGSLAAIATKHHLDHDRWDRRGGYREVHYYERERPRRYCPPKRVEHYVIHERPRYREYERVYKRGHGHGHGHHRGHGRRGGGYEYEYEYTRTGF